MQLNRLFCVYDDNMDVKDVWIAIYCRCGGVVNQWFYLRPLSVVWEGEFCCSYVSGDCSRRGVVQQVKKILNEFARVGVMIDVRCTAMNG